MSLAGLDSEAWYEASQASGIGQNFFVNIRQHIMQGQL